LLARAQLEQFPTVSIESWLCRAFEVERHGDDGDWPIAPLTLALDGGEAGGAYWLRADPVHIKVSREGLHLVDSALFDVSPEEAQGFVEALNAHFANNGLAFFAPRPKRWYVKCTQPAAILTHPIGEVAGKDVQSHLPRGEHALQWHGRFNEAQMLLHSHPLNDAREERGEPPVNSVWFWGGGVLPAVPGQHFSSVSSNDAAATALAAAADIPQAELPVDAHGWLATHTGGDAAHPHLVILDQLASAIAYEDIDAWRTRLAALEAQWFAPLMAALRSGKLAQLAIVALGADHSSRFSVTRGDLFKFWRRPRPLGAYS
jgi:hypothetical protein